MGERIEMRPHEYIVYHCDLCGRANIVPRSCYGCGDVVCVDCSYLMTSDPITNDRYGDYAPRMCVRCQPIAERYREQCAPIHAEYDAALEVMERAFRSECAKAKGEVSE